MICWKCKEAVQSMICVSCSTIQPPPPAPDFFKILSLSRTYFLSEDEITSAHRNKIRLVHPDRFVKKSAVERRMSLQWTAFLNEGKRVLLNAYIRARYIATGKIKPKELGGPRLSGEFLEYIFDVQMELGALEKTQKEQITKITQNITEMKLERLKQIESTFDAWEKDHDFSLESINISERWYLKQNIFSDFNL